MHRQEGRVWAIKWVHRQNRLLGLVCNGSLQESTMAYKRARTRKCGRGVGTLYVQATENSDNKCKVVERQISRVQVQQVAEGLMARLWCDHPCRSVAHTEVANTVPGDVICDARCSREQGRLAEIQSQPGLVTDRPTGSGRG